MRFAAYGLLLLAALFWGGNGAAGKLAVGHVSPMLLTCARWAISFAILLALGRGRLRADWPLVRPKLPLLGLLGFLGFSAFNLSLYSALQFTSAVNTSIEQAGIPMLIFAFNFLLFGARVSPGQALGFLLSLLGVAITVSHGDPARLLALDVNFGDALMIIAVVGYALYAVLLRLRPPVHWLAPMIAMTGFAFASSLPFALGEWLSGNAILPDATGWGVVAYAALFPSILAQIFFIQGVAAIGANRAGLFVNLVPVFGTLLAVLVVGEAFQPFHALALALVLAGIGLAEWSGRRDAG